VSAPSPGSGANHFSPGSRLGPYEIIGPLGAGGMGEVYRARDSRLGRDVAIKVLPAELSADSVRLKRFEQESRAAGALNHPNLLSVFDTGIDDGEPYIVFELLRGETLRARLAPGPLPTRKAVECAVQIAHGLAAAHQAGIVHRDLKPENVFVTEDGRIKILDFGLAKLRPVRSDAELSDEATASEITGAGTVLGTANYMSPEQVQAQVVDHRSDIFSFGSLFYEMLSGQRAFPGDTSVETMRAILKQDPADLTQANGNAPPALDRIVRRCLEKRPAERFQSARDIAFALEAVSSGTGPQLSTAVGASPKRRLVLGLLATTLVLAIPTVSFLVGQQASRPPPSFQRVSFRLGSVASARFAPDGQIVYSASFQQQPFVYDVFTTRQGSTESRALGLTGARILSVSGGGEMALSRGMQGGWIAVGTLFRVPLAGGAPRDLMDDVDHADWTPDGSQLAVVRRHPGEEPVRWTIEFPIGTKLYESLGWISAMRVSPRGDQLAFQEGDEVLLLDRSGKKAVLAKGLSGGGLAWSADGKEVWVTARRDDDWTQALRALTLSGRERILLRAPDTLFLQDISRDGRVLLTRQLGRFGILCLAPGETKERELGWLDGSMLKALSRDGRTIVFNEEWIGGGRSGGVYLRKTDAAPAIRLADGSPEDISPDGTWVLARPTKEANEWILLPTGPGSPRTLPRGTVASRFAARWLGNGKRIIFGGAEQGRRPRVWVQEVDSGTPRPISPEGVWTNALATPDDRFVLGRSEGTFWLYPVDGGDPRPMPLLTKDDDPRQWSVDGRFLYVRSRFVVPAEIHRLDLSAGRRELWKTLVPPDNVDLILTTAISPDGKSYCYDYIRGTADLFVVEGLK